MFSNIEVSSTHVGINVYSRGDQERFSGVAVLPEQVPRLETVVEQCEVSTRGDRSGRPCAGGGWGRGADERSDNEYSWESRLRLPCTSPVRPSKGSHTVCKGGYSHGSLQICLKNWTFSGILGQLCVWLNSMRLEQGKKILQKKRHLKRITIKINAESKN